MAAGMENIFASLALMAVFFVIVVTIIYGGKAVRWLTGRDNAAARWGEYKSPFRE